MSGVGCGPATYQLAEGAAFDQGYISFDDNGKILLSSAIQGAPAYQLRINAKMRIDRKRLDDRHRQYLEVHRQQVFLDWLQF